MHDKEREAHGLAAELTAAGFAAQVSGAGEHWQVEVGAAERSLWIHCFWYDEALADPSIDAAPGRRIGPSPNNNSRRILQAPPRRPHHGPEFLVMLLEDEAGVAEGRARRAAEVVTCVRGWLAERLSLEQLVLGAPFVDAGRRVALALAAQLPPPLTYRLGGDPSFELRVEHEGRSCVLQEIDGAVTCAFLLGPAQLACCQHLTDVGAATSAWLLERAPLPELVARMAELAPPCLVELERHAEVLALDPTRWHWLRLVERVASPYPCNILKPLRALVEVLSQSPIATTFYPFSSHYILRFSASSHFPWVVEGLPLVVRAPDGPYLFQAHHYAPEEHCDLATAVARIEAVLAACPVRPFFGTADDLQPDA